MRLPRIRRLNRNLLKYGAVGLAGAGIGAFTSIIINQNELDKLKNNTTLVKTTQTQSNIVEYREDNNGDIYLIIYDKKGNLLGVKRYTPRKDVIQRKEMYYYYQQPIIYGVNDSKIDELYNKINELDEKISTPNNNNDSQIDKSVIIGGIGGLGILMIIGFLFIGIVMMRKR